MALRIRPKMIPFSRSLVSRCLSTNNILQSNTEHYRFAVVGAGAGGLSIASYLSRKFPNQVAVIEPSDVSLHDFLHDFFEKH